MGDFLDGVSEVETSVSVIKSLGTESEKFILKAVVANPKAVTQVIETSSLAHDQGLSKLAETLLGIARTSLLTETAKKGKRADAMLKALNVERLLEAEIAKKGKMNNAMP